MSMNVKTKQTVIPLTPQDLERIVEKAVNKALHSVRVDARGCLIFPNEEAYAAYLKTQPEKLPSEAKAYYIDPQGFHVHYSDYEPTPKKARELDAARKERTVSHEMVRETLKSRGVKV